MAIDWRMSYTFANPVAESCGQRTLKVNICRWVLIPMVLALSCVAFAQQALQEQGEWQRHFQEFDATGTIVVLDRRQQSRDLLVYDRERAAVRYSPASTFKIPHTLFALDAGVVRDEFEVFPWDGVERGFAAQNQDQDLRSAMRNSALWVYRLFAEAIGEENAANYLQQLSYGNADISVDSGDYWVNGKLAISALEQVSFLQALYQNALPFAEAHQRLVKDVMIVEAGRDWILRAKTGWDGQAGWWVGWVDTADGPVFFALHIDTPGREADLYKREAVARRILVNLSVLPD